MMFDIFNYSNSCFSDNYCDTENMDKLIKKVQSKCDNVSKVDPNNREELTKSKKDIENIISEIEKNNENEYFKSLMKITEYITGVDLIEEMHNIIKWIDNKLKEIEEKRAKEQAASIKKDVKECCCCCNENNPKPKDLLITSQMVKDELCQKILVNKQSDESQTMQLCSIIADFLNTGSPKLKDTNEDWAKLNAAANLLFGFADYTLHK